jgi:hypothetical protein
MPAIPQVGEARTLTTAELIDQLEGRANSPDPVRAPAPRGLATRTYPPDAARLNNLHEFALKPRPEAKPEPRAKPRNVDFKMVRSYGKVDGAEARRAGAEAEANSVGDTNHAAEAAVVKTVRLMNDVSPSLKVLLPQTKACVAAALSPPAPKASDAKAEVKTLKVEATKTVLTLVPEAKVVKFEAPVAFKTADPSTIRILSPPIVENTAAAKLEPKYEQPQSIKTLLAAISDRISEPKLPTMEAKAVLPPKVETPAKLLVPLSEHKPTIKTLMPVVVEHSSSVKIVPLKTESTIKTLMPLKAEASLKTLVPLKAEQGIKTLIPLKADSSLKTLIPLKVDSSVKTLMPLKADSSVKTLIPLKTESGIKTLMPVTKDGVAMAKAGKPPLMAGMRPGSPGKKRDNR